MKVYLLFVLALLGLSRSSLAQLPEAPEPKPITQTKAHATSPAITEREGRNPFVRVYESHHVSLISAAVGRSADAAITCINLEKFHGKEDILPFKTCVGVAIFSEATVPLGWLAGKLFHHYGWRKVETLPNWINADFGFGGLGYSLRYTLNHDTGKGHLPPPVGIHPPLI